MQRATSVLRKAAVKHDRVADNITLDHHARHRRRIVLTGDKGTAFLLDLAQATVLNDGDALVLDDGRLIAVTAAPEKLIAARMPDPLRLMKLAWHLGNRHVPTEITGDVLYFADDHVLAAMMRGLGASIETVNRPFRPEQGAYHHHDHGDAREVEGH